MRFEIDAAVDCVATVTTQAAEKIYRAAGADSEIDVTVTATDCGFLEWMPQETILFDGARLRRRTRLDIKGSARVLAGEIVVFGRRARDEKFTYGFLHDDWRVFKEGRLVWADALHLESDIGGTIENAHAFDGAAAVATAIYCAPDAAERLECVREFQLPTSPRLPRPVLCVELRVAAGEAAGSGAAAGAGEGGGKLPGPASPPLR